MTPVSKSASVSDHNFVWEKRVPNYFRSIIQAPDFSIPVTGPFIHIFTKKFQSCLLQVLYNQFTVLLGGPGTRLGNARTGHGRRLAGRTAQHLYHQPGPGSRCGRGFLAVFFRMAVTVSSAVRPPRLDLPVPLPKFRVRPQPFKLVVLARVPSHG
jgi:hypothetical protein